MKTFSTAVTQNKYKLLKRRLLPLIHGYVVVFWLLREVMTASEQSWARWVGSCTIAPLQWLYWFHSGMWMAVNESATAKRCSARSIWRLCRISLKSFDKVIRTVDALKSFGIDLELRVSIWGRSHQAMNNVPSGEILRLVATRWKLRWMTPTRTRSLRRLCPLTRWRLP